MLQMACRICLEESGELISPCACKGTAGYVHVECLEQWVHTDGKNRKQCEICQQEFASKETCACEPTRCCTQCMHWTVLHPDHLRYLLYVFGSTLCIASWTSLQHYIILSMVSSVSLFFTFMSHALLKSDMMHEYLNMMVAYKSAFSLAFFVALFAQWLIAEDKCDTACISMGHLCNEGCPVIKEFNRITSTLDYNCIFELISYAFFMVIRGLFMCCLYMKKKTYQNLREEDEWLLNSSSSPSSSSSASGDV